VPLWDNARWIAITLVVIGHGILPLIAEDDVAYSVYLVIYSFHVAVFVTVAGYFAKSGPPNARALRQILTDIVFPFFIFETIWTVIRWVLGGSFELDYTTASWTLWFLIALAIWRIVLPYLVLLRFPLLIAIAISIGAGYTETIDATFALSRCRSSCSAGSCASGSSPTAGSTCRRGWRGAGAPAPSRCSSRCSW
jgi:fucose 4-O-acetylase-like acetyltransferase